MLISRRSLLRGAGATFIVPKKSFAFPHGRATLPTHGLIIAGDSRRGCFGNLTSLALGNPSQGDCGSPLTQSQALYYSNAASVPLMWRNMAISGTRLNTNGFPDLVPLAQLLINPLAGISPFKGLKLAVINGIGINDLCVGSRGNGHADLYAGDCAAENVVIKNALLALGAPKVATALCTVPPSNSNGLVQANWTQFNSTVTGVGWAAANGVDVIIDLNSQAQMGQWSAPADTTLYTDGLHYTALGTSLFVPIELAGVNALIAALA